MNWIFASLGRTLTAGAVLLAAIVYASAQTGGAAADLPTVWFALLLRYLHVSVAIVWLGLLWYFNLVQMPSMAKIDPAHKPAVVRVIAPTALFWFRHAALWTVVTGLVLAAALGELGAALMLAPGRRAIGMGMWLALLMAANVWLAIWPLQRRALGLVPADDAERALAAHRAARLARLNTMLSVPMLYGMIAQQHGGL